MIQWLNKQPEAWEGIFKSEFFRNEDNQNELFLCAECPVDDNYINHSVNNFNAISENRIQEICQEIIRLAQEGGENEEFILPELENPEEILEYCWFTTLYINQDKTVILEGEGDWGEVIGIVFKNNKIIYIGTEYFN
ncbi:MAG: hypothetical protein IJ642_06000 [Oscillospiraceae bacterium]|nr:hypothetical protein [Oscillospiraceae bacterium]